jgi:hypothetical protein
MSTGVTGAHFRGNRKGGVLNSPWKRLKKSKSLYHFELNDSPTGLYPDPKIYLQSVSDPNMQIISDPGSSGSGTACI